MHRISQTRKTISMALKLIVIVSAIAGTVMSASAGRNSFMGGSRVFMYFTIQSNIAIALISLIGFCLLMREKAAFSDAVGHSMVDYLKEYAENYYSDEEFELDCTKYAHSKPFTKESLLYREIFEKYYPKNSEMIVDFWMPNKEWEGCNVNDPSARVLSNYGESGK